VETKPFILTIFGASGDLAKIKLFPSIYNLMLRNKLPEEFYIIGFARTRKTREEFQKEFADSIVRVYKKVDNEILNKLLKHVHYVSGFYDDGKSFVKLKNYIKKITPGKRLFKISYLSVPPNVFKDIIRNLASLEQFAKKDMAIIIEKPFGGDVISANSLYYFIVQYFSEDQIYLLDHYLGKQSVRSIFHLRHHNKILNSMLKGKEVSNIQITAIEDFGVKNRIGYFDQVGIIRDMIQSHLLQLLALVTMSIPITESAESIHREKESILQALTMPYSSKDRVSLGQYKTYKELDGVDKSSNTETFAALRLFIDRETWHKVPIYIRTGKNLNKKYTSIVVTLGKFSYQSKKEPHNRVIFELYPEEKISIVLSNKFGQEEKHRIIIPEHSISCHEDDCLSENAILLLEVMQKNRKYFLSFAEVIASWEIVDKIFDYLKKKQIKPEIYSDHSIGPKSQNDIPKHDGFEWFDPYNIQ
jgi:glucose-6-phosphate 1-dehydrogenase